MSKSSIVQSRRASKVTFKKYKPAALHAMLESNTSDEEEIPAIPKRGKTSILPRGRGSSHSIPDALSDEMNSGDEFDFNLEVNNLVKSLKGSENRVSLLKRKQKESDITGVLNQHVEKLARLVNTESEDIDKFYSSYSKQYFDNIKQLQNENTQSDNELENDMMLLMKNLRKTQNEQNTHKKKLNELHELGTALFKNITSLNQHVGEKTTKSLMELKKKVKGFEKDIVQKAQENQIKRMKQSLQSALW